MNRHRTWYPPVAVLVLLVCCAAALYEGRPLAEVLDELRDDDGLNIIYSSDLVTPDLKVTAEPEATSPRKILDQVLAPHGLAVENGPGGTLLVVRARDRPDAASSVHGSVRDAVDDTPLVDAHVEVVEAALETQTGPDGRFEFSRVDVGTYTVKVRLPGYFGQRLDNVRVVAGRRTEVVFRLLASPEMVEAVVVTPSRYRLYGDTPQAQKTMSREEIQQVPHLADDVNRIVARMPGVANPDFTSKLYVRGGVDDESLVLVDGMELYDGFHLEPGASLFSIVNSRAVGGMDLATGGFSARYGDRMSGVMDIATLDPSRKHQTNLGISFVNAHVTSEGTFDEGNGEWMAALRRGYLDLLLDIVGDSNTESIPEYGDGIGKVRFRLSDRTALTANVLYASSSLDLLNEDSDTYQTLLADQRNRYAWFGLETAFRPGLFARTLVYTGRLDRDGEGVDEVERQQNGWIDSEKYTRLYGVKQDWTVKLSDRNLLSAGFDAKQLDSEYDYASYTEITDPIFVGPGPPVVIQRESRLDESGWDLAAYVSDRVRFSDSFTAEVGLRWDYQDYTGDDAQVSPRVNLLYEPTGRDSIRFAWGLFYQSQPIHHLQVEDGIETFQPAQRTESAVFGYEHGFDGGWNAGFEVYAKSITSPWTRFENLFHPMDGIGETSSDRIRLDPERARADGVELYGGYAGRGPVSFRVGYALSRAEDWIGDRWEPRNWDQRHALTFSYNHRIGAKWNFNASGIYHSGWPTTAVTAELAQDADGDDYVDFTVGPRNALRYDDYYRLDARASRIVPLRRGSLTFFLEVMNLFASDNPCCGAEFGWRVHPDGTVDVLRSTESWMPLLPSFGINWIF